ncbi:MAG: glycosyltransferase family 2 protein [Candidatus Omnitrophota bacterium]
MRECDIILLSYESPELLKKCVQSVLDHTRVKSRLIIVDNASRDPEVADYLKSLRGNETIEIEKMFSEENLGFAGGMNKGIRLSEAPFICLLNNDCVVTDGWLEEMMAVARSRNDIGLVNPQSNTFGSRSPGRKGIYTELGHAIGFACLIKREVIDRIGYLDESYQGVCYEDTDFSVRAQQAGYISVIAEGAYVFHLEQASRRNLEEKEAIYRRNREIFEKKWGKLLRVLYVANGEKSSEEDFFDTYDRLRSLARERAVISFWTHLKKKDIPGVRHADIGVKNFSRIPNPFLVLLHVIAKKKKYDAVIFEKERLKTLFALSRFLHNAELMSAESLDDGAGLASYLRGGRKNA